MKYVKLRPVTLHEFEEYTFQVKYDILIGFRKKSANDFKFNHSSSFKMR